MMKLKQLLMMAGIAAVMSLSASKLAAQDNPPPGGPGGDRPGRGGRGGGNFDPAQMQERMLEGIRDQFAIKDDAEWKAIEPLVKKVMDARRENAFNGMRMMFRRPGGDNNGGGDRSRRFGGGFGGEPSAEEEALQKAIESKASKEELKTKMAALRKVKQANEAKLKATQDELKKVLTVQQEAVALQMGLVQ